MNSALSTPMGIFSAEQARLGDAPYVFFSPHRYIQGPGVLGRIGEYLTMIARSPAIMISAKGRERFGSKLEASFQKEGQQAIFAEFGGECSHEEIAKQVQALKDSSIDCLIAVGGGKCIDASKCIAAELKVPVVVCPTLASTDAPCSAVSVIYTAEGRFKDVQFFSSNPALVVMDTQIVSQAPLRYLLAGMADALATGYEAATCVANQNARSMVGGKVTLAAACISTLCTETIYKHAEQAIAAMQDSSINTSLEHIIEANTLLSGIGFESGGLAAAHAVASALTSVPHIDENYLHGEMVALGLLVQLILEDNQNEYKRAASLFKQIGLPFRFIDLDLDLSNSEAVNEVSQFACAMGFIGNEPFPIDPEKIARAMHEVERLGNEQAQAA